MPQTLTRFEELYTTLMSFNLLPSRTPAFGSEPNLEKVRTLISRARPFLPAPYRSAYGTVLLRELDDVFARLGSPLGTDAVTLETLCGPIYQMNDAEMKHPLERFLAVTSNLYRSFLDNTKRCRLNIPLAETLPPLAVLQSDPRQGPFTITVEQMVNIVGAAVGIVSMPAGFAPHPFLFGSLTHETGGHDVLHADPGLLPELREGVYALFPDPDHAWLGALWDYWMDEAASDVYGTLNMGPAFGLNFTSLIAVFLGQCTPEKPAKPTMRTYSGADNGRLDPHPTDILRLALVQGVTNSLTGLSPSSKQHYIDALDELARTCAPEAWTIELQGHIRLPNGRVLNMNDSVPLSTMQNAARKVGAYIATSRLAALGGRSVQEIETWDDADEAAASKISSRLLQNQPIVGAGDDAQIIAGCTLALMQDPKTYKPTTELVNAALDDSFANDPIWGHNVRNRWVILSNPPKRQPEADVDPYVAQIIDHNILEDEAVPSGPLNIEPAVKRHQIAPIPWPEGTAPETIVPDRPPSETDPLPKCDVVLVTYTTDEANAMASVLTPDCLAVPPSNYDGDVWYRYVRDFGAYANDLRPGSSPALESRDLGRYMLTKIGDQKVLCFKSSLHMARDARSLPVKRLIKQIVRETGAKLLITTGTAGGVGSRIRLGDAVISTHARFDLRKSLQTEPYNGETEESVFSLMNNSYLTAANELLVAPNAAFLPAAPRLPQIFTGPTVLGQPNVTISTDIFAFDDAGDRFHLESEGCMVEMDDAAVGLACKELGRSAPYWAAIRNASDPQMPAGALARDASKIYMKYGFYTSIQSVLACWAVVLGSRTAATPAAQKTAAG